MKNGNVQDREKLKKQVAPVLLWIMVEAGVTWATASDMAG